MLHVAVVAVMAIMSIGVRTATPESTAPWTRALSAPRDSAASAHTLVMSAAAEDTTLPMSWHGVPGWNGEFSPLLLQPAAVVIPCMAAASCVRERAAWSWAVWRRLPSFLVSFRDPNRVASHVLGCFESICLLQMQI